MNHVMNQFFDFKNLNRFFCFKNFLFVFLVLFVLLNAPDVLAAPAKGGGLPYEDWLDKLVDSATGPVAFSLALIGLVIAGGTLIFGGDLNAFFKSMVFMVLVMSIIIAAPNVLTFFSGKSAEISSLWHMPFSQVVLV